MRLEEKLKRLLKEKGVKQKFLADKLGVKQSTISNYVRGISTPTPHQLFLIAKLLNVDLGYLLDESLEDYPSFPQAQEINRRIKAFLEVKFSSIDQAQKKLAIDENDLSENELPGIPLLTKLANAGCDINWILTGVKLRIK